MVQIHAASLDDKETLSQMVLKELKKEGLQSKLMTPKPPKKPFAPFSTPGGTAAQPPQQGRIFGRRLADLSKLYVSLDKDTDVLVPKFVVSACTYIEKNSSTEGVYRLAGSNSRQKNIRRELEAGEINITDLSPHPSVLDVASLLKQFLRELPSPLLPHNLHNILSEALNKGVSSLLLCLLILPSDHLACLAYICRHMALVAENCAINKMTVKNLAIVLTPSLFPLQDNYIPGNAKDRKFVEGDRKLKIHTTLVEALIENASQIGFLTADIQERYLQILQGQSASEDNLDEESGPSKRKSKKRNRRRSGSLSRVLSAMGKGIRAMARSTTPSKADSSVHSTPLPNFGSTPDYPSPRLVASKRKASADHDLSPTNKSQKRTLESTFTPKMRSRTFSVKRFKRKKSEGKLPKETFTAHTNVTLATPSAKSEVAKDSSPGVSSLRRSSRSLLQTSVDDVDSSQLLKKAESMEWEEELDQQRSKFETDYEEIKAQYINLKEETRLLQNEMEKENVQHNGNQLQIVEERYIAAQSTGTLPHESRETAKQIQRVKRRSSEGRKPRSPSERRIGVIRRRSREREERQSRQSPGSSGPSPRERGRSPGPKRSINRSPVTKGALTPHIDECVIRGRLLRGRPNSTSVGLEKPSPVPMEMVCPNGKIRIKHSFKSKEKPVALKAIIPIADTERSPRKIFMRDEVPAVTKQLAQSDSIASLRNDINHLIEKSFSGTETNSGGGSTSSNDVGCDNVFGKDKGDAGLDDMFTSQQEQEEDVFELSSKMANVSFEKPSHRLSSTLNDTRDSFSSQPDVGPGPMVSSPVTRSQLRRQSHSFEFTKPSMDTRRPAHEPPIRRQSSAFEFHTKAAAAVEPIYENLQRDVSLRASLRRGNSSVKDLIQKMENEARRRVGVPSNVAPDLFFSRPRRSKTSVSDNSIYEDVEIGQPDAKPTSVEKPPMPLETDLDQLRIPLPVTPTQQEEKWIDGSEFFKSVHKLDQPECGRSSIVKIRNENRGRVLDSVSKFSSKPGATPVRRGGPPTQPSGRRISARMGVSASPLVHPPTTRRQTLTGIKTSAGARNSPHYAVPTISARNRSREKSPRQSKAHPAKSPGAAATTLKPNRSREHPPKRKSPRTNGNPGERKQMDSNHRSSNVRRTASHALARKEKEGNRRRRKEKRYLTIGYSNEIRSPLKECQNIQPNVKRSNSDQTTSTKKNVIKSVDTENSYQNVTVFRSRSLKSDTFMSPSLIPESTPGRVRRAKSDRSTPYAKMMYNSGAKVRIRVDLEEGTPRRSPRLQSVS